ncbi:MAG: hypothetical protein NWF01_06965 [Candidatus Bathyarchaeota archaeon]|nr:hypothetical protein [Candidatus Bathyarchaeota archaeon]
MKQSYVLANKISIANADDNNLNLSINRKFYLKYSRFTLKALSKSVFQEFLSDILKLEKIPPKSIDSIRIEIFPAPRKNGLTIAGKCNTLKGKIRIYPKPMRFCDEFRKEYGQYLLVEYAGSRARASLIHELLHLKYGSDEVWVRKLTKAYFSELIKKEQVNGPKALYVCKLIFARMN